MINAIGTFLFLELEGTPIPPQEALRLVTRPGVDGTGFSRIGRRGPEFTLTSKVDVGSNYLAQLLMSYYTVLVGQSTSLIKDNIDSIAHGYVVAVLGVRPRACHALVTTCGGGLNWPSYAWLEAIWRLRAIEIPAGN